MCVGYKLAMNMMKIILSKLIMKYQISTTAKFEDLEMIQHFLLSLKKYPEIVFKKRNVEI